MEAPLQKNFSSPEEEIAFLRGQIAARERAMLETDPEGDPNDRETLTKDALEEYGRTQPEAVLKKSAVMDTHTLHGLSEHISTATEKVDEVMRVVKEQGIKNALTLLEKVGDAHVTDEVHRRLVEIIKTGVRVAELKEGIPPWHVLHMTLFEVALPEQKEESEKRELAQIFSAMEQLYAGMQAMATGKKPTSYAIEIAVAEGSDQIVFYVAVPNDAINLFEKQILSLFPHAIVTEQTHDYNIFGAGGTSVVSVAELKKHPIYPLRTHDEFTTDPLGVIVNAFSKIEREGGGAAVQLVIQAGGEKFHSTYDDIIKRVREGESPKIAIRKSTLAGDMFEAVKGLAMSEVKQKEETTGKYQDEAELFTKKIERPIALTNVRIAVSAASSSRAHQIAGEIEAGFHQFERTNGNALRFTRREGKAAQKMLKGFSFREFNKQTALPLSHTELATLIHVPTEGVESSPQFKQSRAKGAAAPLDLPSQGTLIGINTYRNVQTDIFITPEDRLRHFYIVGQTGTGKTTLMKNMIAQDINAGAGVCMIDPHGTDIADVLSSVPDERRDDVIYFDPARTDMVMGLNMLEYDPNHPEQKTFVVNELFSIFQKLYGAVPESMGPMFEQYFRNATLLVLEDPHSGSTLLDISRVLADADYRAMKLERARNPVVTQFWRDIATKAGGEAALENIVPYITSKFDVFTANDYMRPIIGQQYSSFDFREIMDDKKILLVNLSKGRLGEINSNLIGMIVVGKILMAALSRVDNVGGDYPPFYLHMDEFQNVTTDSIASILSEARKYKLGLTIAHQYIQQIEEKIRDAVFGNVGSMAAFRVGPEDAEFLAHQFEPVFDAGDLINVENRHAYVRLLANGTPTKPFQISTLPPAEGNPEHIKELIEHSYQRYAQPRRKVEMEISARYR